MNIVQQAAPRLEPLEALDKVAKPLAGGGRPRGAAARGAQPAQRHRPGHPLHPVLTDLPIGAWVMSALLDAAGGPAAEGPPVCWSPPAWWPPCRPRLPG